MNLDAYRAVTREAAALGLSLSIVRQRKHLVLQVVDPAGRSGLLIVSTSGSDRRGRWQARAQLRRLARALAGGAV